MVYIHEGKEEPLKGLTVAITASRRALELAHIVSTYGGTPFIAPTVGIKTDGSRAAEESERFGNLLASRKTDYVVFLTTVGLHSMLLGGKKIFADASIIEALQSTKIVARSPKVSSYLEEIGLKHFLLPEESTIEAVVDLLLSQNMKNRTVAIVWHGLRSVDAVERLRRSGAQVIEFFGYSYSIETSEGGTKLLDSLKFRSVAPSETGTLELISRVNGGLIDVITFTSPPSVLNLLEFANLNSLKGSLVHSLKTNVIVAAIGPSTKKALEENGVKVDVIPSTFKMGPMIDSLAEYVINTSRGDALANTRSSKFPLTSFPGSS